MRPDELRQLLQEVQGSQLTVDAAVEKLRELPYADLGFAKVDLHRRLRRGVAEVIYCEGKTPSQVAAIAERIDRAGQTVLGTRASEETFRVCREAVPGVEYNAVARCFYKVNEAAQPRPGRVVVVCAGTSDLPVAEEAAVTAETLGNPVDRVYDVGVAGIHRLLGEAHVFEKARVVIAVAGMEGALPSVVGGLVKCPVVAVPTSVGYGAAFGGLAALLGMLNSCASNVTVVNIDNGFGAAYVANLINCP
ncbi:MAG TPA: nickel pincer cofactor biosynthesis protein LarB [Candidatus Sumerlaeota bacterium]|nr:nickel pincer cofactor biosynthesis protein LarB [Candidatus Sumerlaeota bacterium]HPS00653.1 nickel pincer cofactor biosynthesis protein LarB [Candidatus Sumerlaeota bacterium]